MLELRRCRSPLRSVQFGPLNSRWCLSYWDINSRKASPDIAWSYFYVFILLPIYGKNAAGLAAGESPV